MSWIKQIGYKEAGGRLKKLYNRIKGPGGKVDNIMQVHSLRAHTLQGHMSLYKNVLHHRGNTLPEWYLEIIGLYVSLLNGCDYCVEHHLAGLKRLLADDTRAESIKEALSNGSIDVLGAKYTAGLHYVKKLTVSPNQIPKDDIEKLRNSDFIDGEILEINQVASYFAYANRTVLGLGVNSKGDVLGLSPGDNDNPENWNHR